MAEPSLYLATSCYGGQAQVVYLRSLLALEAACAARGTLLHVELGGGEALVARARAGLMAKFLRTEGFTHLLFVDADRAFEPSVVLALLDAGREVAVGSGLLLIARTAARRLTEAHPELSATLGDVRGASAEPAAMVFESRIDPQTRRYLSDHESVCSHWRALGGEVWDAA